MHGRVFATIDGPGCVIDKRAGRFDAYMQFSQTVFHTLKAPDGLTELAAYFRVFGRHRYRSISRPYHIRGKHDRCGVEDRANSRPRFAGSTQTQRCRQHNAVEREIGGAVGGIDEAQLFDAEPGGRHLESENADTLGLTRDDQYEPRRLRVGYEAFAPVKHDVAARLCLGSALDPLLRENVAVFEQGYGRHQFSRSNAPEPIAFLLFVAKLGDQATGGSRGKQRRREKSSSGLFGDYRQIFPSQTEATVCLGNGQGLPPEFRGLVPQILIVGALGLHDLANPRQGAFRAHETPYLSLQLKLLGGKTKVHGASYSCSFTYCKSVHIVPRQVANTNLHRPGRRAREPMRQSTGGSTNMADSDRFGLKGKTALITGAGGGLGRAHALLFGKYGANVIVNDLGGASDGTGAGSAMADQVVEEIKAAGGNAAANYDSVATMEGGQNMVKTAIDNFGSIDIVVNNAGILRDISFAKQEEKDWDLVLAVHLKGAFCVTKAAWPHMREKGYGRIVMTSSASGIYGNFGQTNYSAAKMGLVGLGQTLALEGEKHNIRTNMIAPVAVSRMTESLMPANVHDTIKPEFVSPLVLNLCSENCDVNGEVFEVGAGHYSRVEWIRSKGLSIEPTGEITPEQVADGWEAINDMSGADIIRSIGESTQRTLAHAMG